MLAPLLLAILASAHERECPPAAVLEGEGATREHLALELEQRGITGAPPRGCPAVRVLVSDSGGAILVAMLDPQGRSAERLTASRGVAAALIESWSRADLSEPLLQMPEPPVAPGTSATPLSVEARLETGLDSDAGGWLGLGAGLCFWMGPLCLGPEVALRAQPLGPGREHPEVRRVGADLLAVAGLRGLQAGRLRIVPSLGVGIGWTRSDSAEPSRFAEPVSRRASRAVAALTVYVPLAERLSMEARVAATFTPSGRGEDRPDLPDLLPADPWGLFTAGLGLRWGTP